MKKACRAHEKKREEVRVDSLWILSSIKSNKANKSKGLMFADVMIKGTTCGFSCISPLHLRGGHEEAQPLG